MEEKMVADLGLKSFVLEAEQRCEVKSSSMKGFKDGDKVGHPSQGPKSAQFEDLLLRLTMRGCEVQAAEDCWNLVMDAGSRNAVAPDDDRFLLSAGLDIMLVDGGNAPELLVCCDDCWDGGPGC